MMGKHINNMPTHNSTILLNLGATFRLFLSMEMQQRWIPEVGDTQVSLLAVAQVRLGDEDVPHGQHTQASNLLGTVEDDRREPAGHLTVQPNLDTLQTNRRFETN